MGSTGRAGAVQPETGGVRRWADALWLLGGRWGIAAGLGVLAVSPVHLVESGPDLCPVLALSGRECPGCGITRAVSWCLHGEFERATEFNLGVVVVFPLLLLLAGRQFARRTRRPTL